METLDVRTSGGPPRRLLFLESGGRVVAAADVDASTGPAVVRAALRGEVQPLPGDAARRLVDAVLELPEVADAERLEAAIPTVDAEMVELLRDRADDVQTRLAGGTVLLVATVRRH